MVSLNHDDYAARRPQMYDTKSREQKAIRIIKLFLDYYGKDALKDLTLLDVGSSTGLIDMQLASFFKSVTGVDVDENALEFAKKNNTHSNLQFMKASADKLPFNEGSFNVVVCTHVYEHVPNSRRLFNEIYRVLKTDGVCYLAAFNRLSLWEPHYNLPFLSWLPKQLANWYVRVAGRGRGYLENPLTYWGLKERVSRFRVVEYTQKILRAPMKFGYGDIIRPPLAFLAFFLSPLSKYFAPVFFWLLIKK